MVAVIHSSSSLRNALNYNEQKVLNGQAKCLAAVNYPKDVERLSFYQKLARLQNQAELNSRTKVNSVHISLNFAPSEHFSEEKFLQISGAYLEKIGFGEQPYLVYSHHDAGHPHLHIVTTNIRANGKRIELHNLGKNLSEKARKEVEQSFGLIRAADHKRQQSYNLNPVNAQKALYGKSETKRAIANVLNAVLNGYKYTSLPELNAVLKQYNVGADRGQEGSRLYLSGGLTYRLLDENGDKIGVPIKASAFYNKPTLNYLQTRFDANEIARQPYKTRVRNAIDLALLKHPAHSVESLSKSLEKEGIYTLIRQSDKGMVYGLTYVDHKTKTVFNGSDLGKQYSAKGILERWNQTGKSNEEIVDQRQKRKQVPSKKELAVNAQKSSVEQSLNITISEPANDLVQPSQVMDYLPNNLKKSKKKKRKRQSIRL